MSMPDGVNIDLYSRNGFDGPLSTIVRTSYSPGYTRVEGPYRPQRIETQDLPADATDRNLPVTLLRSPTVRFDFWHRNADTPFSLRDVRNDQLMFVVSGSARLETDFGVLDLEPLDMIIVPRAVTYRLSRVDSLRTMLLVTPEQLSVASDATELLGREVDLPKSYDPADSRSGEQEVIVQHGDTSTSFFFDYDPLPVLGVEGAPTVQRFTLRDVTPPASVGPVGTPPARLVSGAHSETLVFYLGARESARPPVHHNADYDEVGIYACGPGVFGRMTQPGTMVWVPKGLIHQGPEENVPDGYVGWLFETRANLELTPAGAGIAATMETSLFGIHPSANAAEVSR